MGLAEEKAAARKLGFAARRRAHATGGDNAACAALHAHVSARAGAVVAAYMPIRTEISPLEAMAALFSEGRRLCVPVILGDGKPLKFSAWEPGCEMVEGPFGARVPAHTEYLLPDIVITPLVAFDARGYRLGYGGGFYDRSFEELKALKPVHAVGFAYAGQELAKVPVEPTDQRLDALVTEHGARLF